MSRPSKDSKSEAPHKVAKEKANRRQDILDVSAQLFAEKGFKATSIRAIGESVGILAGSLYHHFRSKEEILHELLRGFISELLPHYETVSKIEGDSREIFKELVKVGLTDSLKNSRILQIISHERKFMARNPDFRYVEETWEDVYRIWYGILQEGVRQGVFRDDLSLNLILRMIMDLIDSTTAWYGPHSRYSIDEVAETQIGLLLNGLCGDHSAAAGQSRTGFLKFSLHLPCDVVEQGSAFICAEAIGLTPGLAQDFPSA